MKRAGIKFKSSEWPRSRAVLAYQPSETCLDSSVPVRKLAYLLAKLYFSCRPSIHVRTSDARQATRPGPMRR